MLGIFANCLLDVFGGMVLAAGAAWLAWTGFQRLRYPEVGPWVVVVAIVLTPGAMGHSLLQMMLIFLGVISLCLIPAGRAWRKRERLRRLFHLHNIAVLRRDDGRRHPPRHLV